MPTYEYRCRDCGRDFDMFQRMSDEPRAECPDCGELAERLISGGAGLLFKGDGFYITDYRSDAYRKKATQESGGDSGSGNGDAAPAAKSDTGAAAGAADTSAPSSGSTKTSESTGGE